MSCCVRSECKCICPRRVFTSDGLFNGGRSGIKWYKVYTHVFHTDSSFSNPAWQCKHLQLGYTQLTIENDILCKVKFCKHVLRLNGFKR